MQFAKLRYCCALPRRMPKVRNVQLCCRQAAKLNEEPLTAIAHLKAAVPECPTKQTLYLSDWWRNKCPLSGAFALPQNGGNVFGCRHSNDPLPPRPLPTGDLNRLLLRTTERRLESAHPQPKGTYPDTQSTPIRKHVYQPVRLEPSSPVKSGRSCLKAVAQYRKVPPTQPIASTGTYVCRNSASMILRISNFCALPVTVMAKASTIRMWRGTL